MAIKRDSVNRKTYLVRLPIKLGGHIQENDTITLTRVVENEILPTVKDPMAEFGQPDGSNYGDGVFDAMESGAESTIFDPMAAPPYPIVVLDPMKDSAVHTTYDPMLISEAPCTIFDPLLKYPREI